MRVLISRITSCKSNLFYRDNAALAVHPSNPRMSSTLVQPIRGFITMHTYYYVLTIKLVVSLITSRLNLSALTTKLVVTLIANSKKACPLGHAISLLSRSWTTRTTRTTVRAAWATWALWAHSLFLDHKYS